MRELQPFLRDVGVRLRVHALDELGTATPDRDDGPDNVEEAGLERAPANEKDVEGVVVVIADFAGATVLDVAELRAVASLL